MSTVAEGLALRGISKTFPGTKALDGVDLQIDYGQVTALIGENGAGKSTLMKVLSGVYRPDSGSMTLDGQPYAPKDPRNASERGVTLIHQELSLLPNLTIAENIFIGRQPLMWGMVNRRQMNRDAAKVLQRVGLDISPDRMTSEFSVAIQQRVEIAKALSQEPRILVFDEPTATLGAEEVQILFELIHKVKRENVGLVWITHRLDEIVQVADNIVVLRDGQRVKEWPVATVPVSQLVESMVGRSIANIYPEPAQASTDVVLEVKGLGRTGEFTDVSFQVRAGEVFGIAGLVGAGRSEVVNAITGSTTVDHGEIFVRGKQVKVNSPKAATLLGMALIPEDRRHEGIATRLTVADNVTLPSRARLRGFVDNGRLKRQAEQMKEQVGLRGHLEQLAGTLSGGNQQKGVIAKWLPLNPQIIVFDEPTRGIDVGAKSAIYDVIRELSAAGTAVIVVSSEMSEVLGLSHRVAVLSRGRLTGILSREEATEEAVMALAVA